MCENSVITYLMPLFSKVPSREHTVDVELMCCNAVRSWRRVSQSHAVSATGVSNVAARVGLR